MLDREKGSTSKITQNGNSASEERNRQKILEKQFAKRLSKAGWHTYLDEETGRVVTNANEDERLKLQEMAGLVCEVVSRTDSEECCVRIGPKL